MQFVIIFADTNARKEVNMYNGLLALGTPFDPTTNAYWIEPSQSFKRSKTDRSLINKSVLSRLDMPEGIQTYYKASRESRYFIGQRLIDICSGVDELAIEDKTVACIKKRFDLYASKKDTESRRRYSLFNMPIIHDEIITYVSQWSKRLESTWFYKVMLDYMRNRDVQIDSEQNCLSLLKGLPPILQGSARAIIDFIQFRCSHGLLDLPAYWEYIPYIFDDLYNGRNVKEVFKISWLISYLGQPAGLEDIFCFIAYNFKSIFIQNEELFPYVNYPVFEHYFAILDGKDVHGVSNYDNYLVFQFFTDNFKTLVSQHEQMFIIDTELKSTALGSIDFAMHFCAKNAFVINKAVTDSINQIVENFKAQLASFNYSKVELKQPLLTGGIDNFRLIQLKNYIYSISINLGFESSNFNPDQYILAENELNEKAKQYAVDPLNYINELNALAAEKLGIQEDLKSHQSEFLQEVEKAVCEYNEFVQHYNDSLVEKKSQNLEEVETLKGLLSDSEYRLSEALRNNKLILQDSSKELSKAYAAINSIKQNDPVSNLISIIECENILVEIVNQITSSRPWVKISNRLIKDLEDINCFSKPAELAKALGTLTSKEFIDAYSSGGSAAAFNYFSKTALAFKESESTMSNHSLRKRREFMFADKKVVCEPHIRIGVNNTEQQQLRVHFSIEGEEIYIGYIGRHLPTE